MMDLSMTAMLLQQGGMSPEHDRIQVIFSSLVAIALVIQAIVVVVFVLGAMKTKKELMVLMRELQARALPLIATTQELVQENGPRIHTITKNLAETSHIVREKAADLESVVSDATRRAKAQTARVDGLVTDTITRTQNVTEQIQRAVMMPLRQVSGVMNGFMAGLETLKSRAGHFTGNGANTETRTTADRTSADRAGAEVRATRESIREFDKNYPAKGEDYHA